MSNGILDTELEQVIDNLEQPIQEEETSVEGSKTLAGKFNNVQELEKAYEQLQSEFTRKSQKLSQLQELNEDLNKGESNADNEQSPEVMTHQIEAFLEKFPIAEDMVEEIAEEIASHPEWQSIDGLYPAFASVLSSKYKTPEQLLEDNDFIEKYILQNDTINSRVITDYVRSLGQTDAPPLMGKDKSGLLPAVPKASAASLHDAAKMAREFFK